MHSAGKAIAHEGKSAQKWQMKQFRQLKLGRWQKSQKQFTFTKCTSLLVPYFLL